MAEEKAVPLDEKVKALPIEQQAYINGWLDGVLARMKGLETPA